MVNCRWIKAEFVALILATIPCGCVRYIMKSLCDVLDKFYVSHRAKLFKYIVFSLIGSEILAFIIQRWRGPTPASPYILYISQSIVVAVYNRFLSSLWNFSSMNINSVLFLYINIYLYVCIYIYIYIYIVALYIIQIHSRCRKAAHIFLINRHSG